jgi:hypothetical protein
MLEFELFHNGFRFLFLFLHSRGFRLVVSNIGLVVAMLFGFFEIWWLYRLYRARVGLTDRLCASRWLGIYSLKL